MVNTKLVAVSCWIILSSVFIPAQNGSILTLEKIFSGQLNEPSPSGLRWAPDERQLAFFSSDECGDRALWAIDSVTGAKSKIASSDRVRDMAFPSAAVSERERTRRLRYDIPTFIWSPDSKKILLSGSGRLHLYDIASRKSKLLASSKSNIKDPKFSPDGKWISFVYNHDIWRVSSDGGDEKQLTSGGSELLLHGDLDWVYQEEFDLRIGYHWSPDSHCIAFLELNEKEVPIYPLVNELSSNATVDWQHYPKPGDSNPVSRVGFVDVMNGKVSWMDRRAEYAPRIDWADSRSAVIQLLNREQNEIEIIEVNPATGKSRKILKERDRHWLDVTDDLKFISGGRQFLWTSSRSGFRHIYLYSRNGELQKQLTSGEWVVYEISGIDEKNGWIYYSSNEAETTGSCLYRIKMDGAGKEQVTKEPGVHEIQMNGSATALVDSFSSQIRPPETNILDINSGNKTILFQERNLDEFGLVVPEMKELKTPDGETIRILMHRPTDISPGEKLPVIVYVYGMPDYPTIKNAWPGTRGLFHQFLVQKRFLVVLIDDRTSAIPGHVHSVAAYHNLGTIAAKDHETAVRFLKTLPYVDSDKMAVWGWSGGGFMAAYHMTHTRLFQCGIAGAPVTDWRLYDSIYSERYMGLPEQDSDAYERASAVSAASNYNGRLLIIHGTQDDNVHLQNTYKLISALIENGKQFELMIYPGKTHGISGATENVQLYTMIYQFMLRNLIK